MTDEPLMVTVELTPAQAEALREVGRQRVEEAHGSPMRPNKDWVEGLKDDVDPTEVVSLLLRDAIEEVDDD